MDRDEASPSLLDDCRKHVESQGMGLWCQAKCGVDDTESRLCVEKHEAVAKYKSDPNER